MNVMSVEQLWHKRADADYVVLDVREAGEIESLPYTKIENLITIPMAEVQNRLAEVDKEKNIVVACRSGGRSGVIADMLSNHGYNAFNLTGGILAWQPFVEQQS